MGAIDEISGDGKGALMAGPTESSSKDQQKARRRCATYALTTAEPHPVLQQLLDALDLNPQEGDTR